MKIEAGFTRRGIARPAFQIDDDIWATVSGTSWSLTGNGYLQGRFAGKRWSLHRLVWFLATGRNPPMLDHISRDQLDNRLANLREASASLNNRNRRQRKRSGLPPGVRKDPTCESRYEARTRVNGVLVVLGRFDSPEEAGQCYELARLALLQEEDANV
jgi:hypothetical protein